MLAETAVVLPEDPVKPLFWAAAAAGGAHRARSAPGALAAACRGTTAPMAWGGTGGPEAPLSGVLGGGGGGGGYFGGGGGGRGNGESGAGGGGGGSSFAAPGATVVVHEQGVNSGAGSVTISW